MNHAMPNRFPSPFSLLLMMALLILPALAALGADEMSPAESAELLQKIHAMQMKEPNFEANFTEERTSHLLNKPVSSEGTVYFSVPDKFRQRGPDTQPEHDGERREDDVDLLSHVRRSGGLHAGAALAF